MESANLGKLIRTFPFGRRLSNLPTIPPGVRSRSQETFQLAREKDTYLCIVEKDERNRYNLIYPKR